jgi:hypothetical protein
LVIGVLTAPATATPTGDCDPSISVRGVEHQVATCLSDLTTAGTVASGHTVPGDYAGLQSARTINPSGVPGLQVDGYFPDDSTTNTHHGWNHDSQFVMRFPDDWNGKLVVTGAPGNRRQYSLDATISDWVLARGYAFAATDKGNTGLEFYRDGKQPGDAIAEWNERVTELTKAAQQTAQDYYGQRPSRTYMTGLSNGGYLTRWQLENKPSLYDGGVDWEGTLLRAEGPNLLTYLPTALRHYPDYVAGSEEAHQAMLDAGFAPGSEFLWELHYRIYWDLTQRIYREELDPSFDGDLQAGVPYCASGTPSCDADYDYFSRPHTVTKAVKDIELTGKLGAPMITLHGDLDTLLPPATDSDVYSGLIDDQGRADLHRYYTVTGGNHVDAFADVFPDRLRPILPCYRDAFEALESWVEEGDQPPASGTIPFTSGAPDLVNSCSIADR